MAALDSSRSPADDVGPARSPAATAVPDDGDLRLEISSAAEDGEIDWATWVELIAMLRQHKFVPRIESLDDENLVLDL